MNTKTGITACALLVAAGITIGVCARKDHPAVTQLVGVPVRVAAIPVAVAPPEAPKLMVASVATVPVTPEAPATYTAKAGDTVSDVAAGLLGTDSKANRAAVIDASPSLQANPDLVVIGRRYDLTPKADPKPAAETAAAVVAPVAPAAPVLKYTANEGDTVTGLASSLMGGDTRVNRDAIVNANPSLKADPDHLQAGKAYRIVAPEGGLAAAVVPADPRVARPTTEPDSDTLLEDAKSHALRYTAHAGDTVSSLASALLGSDTADNRALIINANASLKANPDRVVEGKAYWIPAPVAEVSGAN